MEFKNKAEKKRKTKESLAGPKTSFSAHLPFPLFRPSPFSLSLGRWRAGPPSQPPCVARLVHDVWASIGLCLLRWARERRQGIPPPEFSGGSLQSSLIPPRRPRGPVRPGYFLACTATLPGGALLPSTTPGSPSSRRIWTRSDQTPRNFGARTQGSVAGTWAPYRAHKRRAAAT